MDPRPFFKAMLSYGAATLHDGRAAGAGAKGGRLHASLRPLVCTPPHLLLPCPLMSAAFLHLLCLLFLLRLPRVYCPSLSPTLVRVPKRFSIFSSGSCWGVHRYFHDASFDSVHWISAYQWKATPARPRLHIPAVFGNGADERTKPLKIRPNMSASLPSSFFLYPLPTHSIALYSLQSLPDSSLAFLSLKLISISFVCSRSPPHSSSSGCSLYPPPTSPSTKPLLLSYSCRIHFATQEAFIISFLFLNHSFSEKNSECSKMTRK